MSFPLHSCVHSSGEPGWWRPEQKDRCVSLSVRKRICVCGGVVENCVCLLSFHIDFFLLPGAGHGECFLGLRTKVTIFCLFIHLIISVSIHLSVNQSVCFFVSTTPLASLSICLSVFTQASMCLYSHHSHTSHPLICQSV